MKNEDMDNFVHTGRIEERKVAVRSLPNEFVCMDVKMGTKRNSRELKNCFGQEGTGSCGKS